VTVPFATAIDQVTTFIQGTGSQMDLESIRSRPREGLRQRVRAGRIAGGSCYGYRLERKADDLNRRYTLAIGDDAQAAIVARLFQPSWRPSSPPSEPNNESSPRPPRSPTTSPSWSPSSRIDRPGYAASRSRSALPAALPTSSRT
jgi:hypothetical protein